MKKISVVGRINLFGLGLNEILTLIQPEGFGITHALKITNAIYRKRITSFEEIRQLPRRLQIYLDTISEISVCKPVTARFSEDGTVKYLFSGNSGLKFETVFIPDRKRKTVCVSTQSGCRMGCPFCFTARYGYHGDLSAGDIVSQVTGIPQAAEVTHVVFMGMGEPLDNTENVLKACEILTAEWGLALSPKNITVSTVGITDSIVPFLERSGCNLTLSLFSPFSEERCNVVPAEKKYPTLRIIDIMKGYPLKKKRRLSIAYVMIKDVNDTDRHLEGLKRILDGSSIRVNLIPYNGTGDNDYKSSGNERMMYFRHNLVTSGISASIRRSRGLDISAACGLLAADLGKQKIN